MARPRFLFVLLMLAVAGGALAFRLPRLDQRPMHCDEANQAVRAGLLLETGEYHYDPWDGHGPSLYWLTLPVLWLGGATDLAQITELECRLVPVLFGVGLIALLVLVSDGLGRGPTLIAALLLAISPAFVFYSRYYIQEMLLVFFTFGAIGCAWRYMQGRRLGWALATGACFGMMFATKETWILAAFAMVASLALTLVWNRWTNGQAGEVLSYLRPVPILAAFVAGCLAALVLFSSFGRDWQGVKDSVAAYQTYLHRGSGGGDHDQPWNYYLNVLSSYLPQRALKWTTWPMIGVTVVCWLAAVVPLLFKPRASTSLLNLHEGESGSAEPGLAGSSQAEGGEGQTPHRGLVCFLAGYTVVLTAVYSAIPYKTPWCLLSLLHGMILLAAVGAWNIVRGPRRLARSRLGLPLYRVLTCLLLLAAAGRMGWECYLLNFKHFVSERNPYVYVHTSMTLPGLAPMMERLAEVSPDGHDMAIQVVGPEIWPLPWYLRKFRLDRRWDDCWWRDTDEWAADKAWSRRPAVVLFDPDMKEEIDRRLGDGYRQQMSYNLRPKRVLVFYVRDDLWEAFDRGHGE
jgi:uncharacterized protein (TIGR03663 family)